MQDPIGTEKVVHGPQWGAVHNGYFSNPAVARPLVQAIMEVQSLSPADVIVDLGGGTGFLLSQLAAQGLGANSDLVNVDCSEAQLEGGERAGLAAVHLPIMDFTRRRVAAGDRRLCLAMRSVLHYFGADGLDPLLVHLRGQVMPGEYFVHQSAAFEDGQDAACLNSLYRHMRTHKWYPTVKDLEQRLENAGWHVTSTRPAPVLVLESGGLAHRYALDGGDVARIGDAMLDEVGGASPVFRRRDAGFSADLHYRIFICVAA